MRLLAALVAAKYYKKTNHELTPSNKMWKLLENFEVQHLAMKEKKDKYPPYAPKYQKQMEIPKWIESLKSHVHAIIGVHDVPLLYVICDLDIDPAAAPPLASDQPYSDEHGTGTVEGKLIAQTCHTHPLFKNDNREVFDLLETSLHGANYSATIVQLRKAPDDRSAYFYISVSSASMLVMMSGNKLSAELMITSRIKNRKWSRTNSIPLSSHIYKQRKSYIELTEAAEHILPINVPTSTPVLVILWTQFC